MEKTSSTLPPSSGPSTAGRDEKTQHTSISNFLWLHRTMREEKKVLKRFEDPDGDGFEIIDSLSGTKPDSKRIQFLLETKESLAYSAEMTRRNLDAALVLAKSLFKRDKPFRTVVGSQGVVATNTSGNLDFFASVSNVSSSSEWSSLSTLFDEFYIHSMKLVFCPYNQYQSGQSAGGTGVSQVVSTTNVPTVITSQDLVVAAIFNNASRYGTALGYLSNPNHRILPSGRKWTYRWRNNVRFDPYGVSFNSTATSGVGWQGWQLMSSSTEYGGLICVRSVADVTFGDGSHAYNLGSYITYYDVSFRARI